MIDEITRRIETTKRTKKGGRKMVQVAHRQITLLPIPSSPSLPFFPRREAINLQFFQSFVPPFSSFSKTTAMVRLEAGVEVTCIPWQRSLGNPSQRVDASRTTKGGADFSRNLGEQQPFSPRVKETNFLP